MLKSYGLTNREIEIYRHHLKGAEFLETKYKNLEISALNNILSNIYGKISKGQSGCISSEDDDSNAKYSLDPQFQITEKPKQNFLHPDHPLNSLDILTNDLFGHLNNDSTPSASKQRKLVRRYERKFNKPISIPEPKCFSSVKKNVSEEKNSHSYNEFIKAIECSNSLKSSECSKDQQIRNPNSKWDVKTVENKKLSPNQKSSTSKNVLKICKTKEQTEKALYTVKNNKIVRLIKNTETKFDEAKFTTCEITIPQNEAEKRLLEGTKLSVDEIKTLPKFGNYTPGIPTKVFII